MEQQQLKQFKFGYFSFAAIAQTQEPSEENGNSAQIEEFTMVTVEDWSNLPKEQTENLPDPQNVITLKPVIHSANSIFTDYGSIQSYFNANQITSENKNGLFSSEILLGGGVNVSPEGQVANTDELVKLKIIQDENQESFQLESYTESNSEGQQVVHILPVVGHGQIRFGNNVYFLAGNNAQNYYSNNIAYNLETKQFVEKAALTWEKSRACFFPYKDENGKDKIFTSGGFVEFLKSDVEKKLIEIYDFESDKWEKKEAKALTRLGTGSFGFQNPDDKQLYIVGGISNSKPCNQICKIEVGEKDVKFKKIGSLKKARSSCKGVVIKNEKTQQHQIFIIGGQDKFEIEYFSIKDGQVVDQYNQDLSKEFRQYYSELQPFNFPDSHSFIVQ